MNLYHLTCHHRSMQEPGLGESGALYPDDFCELPLFASNHVCLIPQLLFLCPGYCQKRSNLPKSSKIQDSKSITLQTNDIQIYDLEHNRTLRIAYQFIYLAWMSNISHFHWQLLTTSDGILFTQQNSPFTWPCELKQLRDHLKFPLSLPLKELTSISIHAFPLLSHLLRE